MIIGITGGIASGKSTLSNLLKAHGFPVYDSDLEARRLQNEHPEIISQTKALFGDDIYVDGQLNRPAVATLVFQNPELLKKLTNIVHPVVKAEFLQWTRQFKPNKLIFIESAILFEANFDKLVDKVILLTVSEEIRIQRVMERDGSTRKQVLARIKNQIPDTEKIPKSDLVILTDQGLPDDVLHLIVSWQDRIIP
ncbi:MAG TPA: dephospho-CoA kinase [Paludibacter sp.]|nr:dephospho-CoA kinase [Paludibacter sp.]HOS44955.1 dephospho-CoA kinase [Paludibacter sp.]HPM09520.1 dephospho-CoA kinase [Paludibacter sp.]